MTQEFALALLKSGKNVFLTGAAGTGKTYVLNQYIEYLKSRKVPVAITASTGIAATHINGMTIHAWAGIGVKESINSKHLKTLSTRKYLVKKMEKVEVLIIDEISMLHRKQLEMVSQVLQYFKMNQLPFGGIQLVVCGDFFQLPPVGNEQSKDKFAFMSPTWVQSELNICYLKEQHRQQEDALNDILNQLKSGSLTKQSIEKLSAAVHNQPDIQFEPTKLFTHNFDVDQMNKSELNKLNSKSKFFEAELSGNEKLISSLKNSVLATESMELKEGAKVMFVRNNPEKGVVNGSLGELVDFDEEGFPMVRLLDDRIVIAEPEEWKIQDESGKVLASFKQVPLRLAWAITVHKSQGMTLDAAEIDLSNTFERGQGYVALSRLKKLENLKLIGFNQTALELDPLAFKADQRFQELSNEAENNYSLPQLNKEATDFILKCGGLNDEKEIKKQKGKLKAKKTKESTYDITFSYLKRQVPLSEIAEERGMTEGTIAGHFMKIKVEHPEANLSYYKPKKSIVTQVERIYKELPQSDYKSLKLMYEKLGGKVSYNEIKLALAFII